MLKIDKNERMNWNGIAVELVPYELNGKRWNEIYENEEEMLEHLKTVDMEKFAQRYNGSQFFKSFKAKVLKGEELTHKQMIQLKRLASNLYCYHWNKENLYGG